MTAHTARDAGWTLADLPSLAGTRALVTGVTSGIGLVTADELARAGAEVVLAARNPDKLATTRRALAETVPGDRLVPLVLDLADLDSVRRAADEARDLGPLHLLVNNAGVMATPHRRTVDGFELQLATNHLGHFALTGLLLDQLAASGSARVVTVSSVAATGARGVSLEDPRVPRRYRRWQAYSESKLANLLFTLELDRRARAAGLPLVAVAAHPGWTSTDLVANGMRADDGGSGGPGRLRAGGALGLAVTRLIGQSADDGALPTLMAATADLPGGSYVGPGGPFQLHGPPTLVGLPRPAQDPEPARGLWELSERATGVRYP